MSARVLRCCRLSALVLSLLIVERTARAQNITVQQPVFGIAIDGDGVLSTKEYTDPTGQLFKKRMAQARASVPGDLQRPSDLRKVSLVRLEKALAEREVEGKSPDDAMRHLAGLQRAQYVFFYPEERDIVIAGPAEGWVEDLSGRTVGLTTGRPTLLLEDLIAALRAYPPGENLRPFVGCSIEPTREGLARLAAFQQTIPRRVAQSERDAVAVKIARGMYDSLGMSNIRVFTVSEKTHFARVLIEADHRMKRIGIGLEPPPVKMVTFIAALDSPKMSLTQRWWFTPNYDCVKVTADRLAMELVGQGVQLQAAEMTIGPDGRLLDSGGPTNRANEAFTKSFTKNYEEIARRVPVYAQLRNMMDLVVAAAFLRDRDYYTRAGWNQGIFADESRLAIETEKSPRQVHCSVNALWKGNRLLVPVGGVSIRPDMALDNERMQPDRDGALGARRDEVAGRVPPGRWWWD